MHYLAIFLLLLPILAKSEPKRVLLVGQGPDGHPPTTHEFMAGVAIMKHLLALNDDIVTTTANGGGAWPDGPKLLDSADGVVLFLSEGAKWMRDDLARYQALVRLRERKGGIVALHWAVGAKEGRYIETSLEMIGGCHGGPDRKYTKIQAKMSVADPNHLITRGLLAIDVFDEFYYSLKFVRSNSKPYPVLTVPIAGKAETCAWAWERPDGGRSFGFVGLHFHENWKRPEYRRLVVQAIRWSVDLPIPNAGANVDCPADLFKLP